MHSQLPDPIGRLQADVVPPTCPFFRSVTVDGALRPAVEVPDGANRCTAYGSPQPQSPLQQELVCLTSGHVDCPRYLEGAARVERAAARFERVRSITRPTAAALAFVVLSLATSFSFVLANGGLTLPDADPGGGEPEPVVVAAADAGRSTDAGATPAAPTRPAASPTDPPAPSPTPEPTASPTPQPTPDPTPAPTPRPTTSPADSPEPVELAGLEPCPDQGGCVVYTVRSGDSLWAIGDRFGHSLDTVYDWNPWTRTRNLRPGAEIRLPPPNR